MRWARLLMGLGLLAMTVELSRVKPWEKHEGFFDSPWGAFLPAFFTEPGLAKLPPAAERGTPQEQPETGRERRSARRLAENLPALALVGPKIPSDEPEAEPAPSEVATVTTTLIGLARDTPVYARPAKASRRVGYLRLGTPFDASAKSTRGKGCDQGWHSVRPYGFVCLDQRVTKRSDHPVTELATSRADRLGSLPYVYVRVKEAGVPLYTRLPTKTERLEHEGKRPSKVEPKLEAMLTEPVPTHLAEGRPTPTLHGYARPKWVLYSERAVARSSFAISRFFEHEGRRFGLTPDLLLLPLDRVSLLEPSTFSGVRLADGEDLPVGFVTARAAQAYQVEEATGALRPLAPLTFREPLLLSDRTMVVGGRTYWEARDHKWVRADQVRVVRRDGSVLSKAKKEPKFIDVSLEEQSLVAFDGGRPVFVTLVSTGLDSPKKSSVSPSGASAQRAQSAAANSKSHPTVRGSFRIYDKHLTAPMTSDASGDEYALPDVPYVQYFHQSFALHGAYWHDGFGTPKSHGCINLSPEDARFLFGFTSPPVPKGWHGASDPIGTAIDIRP